MYRNDYGCEISAEIKNSPNDYTHKNRFQFRIFFNFQSTDNSPVPLQAQNLTVHRVSKSKIDFDLVRSWYSKCRDNHKKCRSTGYETILNKPKYMRLIDVEALCLIIAPPECHYVTLSYVWGNVKSVDLTNCEDDVIDLRPYLSLLPQTIQDAIDVVRELGKLGKLGIKYLWVDDICILETASSSKVSQFSDMHKIYGNAEFTIVAAQGKHAGEGLYGVRCGSRPNFEAQISSAIDSNISLVRELTLPSPIDSSKWSTRAWCLQEQVLSKAFLVFSDNQVYWNCPSAIKFEDLSLREKRNTLLSKESKPSYDSTRRKRTHYTKPTASQLAACRIPQLPLISQILNPGAPVGMMDRNTVIRANGSTLVMRPGVFEAYTSIVAQYSRREITHASDALHAIDGVLTVLSHGFNKTEMLFGLPESFLDAALLWRARTPLKRRCEKSIPSWAWAGWEGAVGYQDTVEVVSVAEKSSSGKVTTEVVKSRDQEPLPLEHFERIRPWVQWHRFKYGEESPVLVNGGGIGIACENSLWPEDWRQREHARGFSQEDLDANQPRPAGQMVLQMYTLRTAAFRPTIYDGTPKQKSKESWGRETLGVNSGNQAIGSNEGFYGSSSERKLIDSRGDVAGHLTLDGVLVEVGLREIALAVVSEAQYFDDLIMNLSKKTFGSREDEFKLFNVMLVSINQETGLAERRGVGKVTKKAFMGWADLKWGLVSLS